MVIRLDLDAAQMKRPRQRGIFKAHDPLKLSAFTADSSESEPMSCIRWTELAGIARKPSVDCTAPACPHCRTAATPIRLDHALAALQQDWWVDPCTQDKQTFARPMTNDTFGRPAGEGDKTSRQSKKVYYIHRSVDEKDRAPAFVQRMSFWAKATNELAGLVRGLLADGVVSEAEALYLRDWIRKRPELLSDPLVVSLAARVERVFSDGAVTEAELRELREILHDYGGESEEPMHTPFTVPPPDLFFQGKCYCFTGVFLCGDREWCEKQVLQRGAVAHSSMRSSTDYLVVGSKVSNAWANQRYGRKIEEAMRRRQSRWGSILAIVGEDHWLRFLQLK